MAALAGLGGAVDTAASKSLNRCRFGVLMGAGRRKEFRLEFPSLRHLEGEEGVRWRREGELWVGLKCPKP